MVTTRVNRSEPHDVLCTRPGRWGNHYVIGVHGDRGQCCVMFREYALDIGNVGFRNMVRRELAGKRLACACGPHQACHVDVYVEIAEGVTPWWAREAVSDEKLF